LGGYVEKGEAPLAAVQRELLEETGLQSSEWEHLGSYVTDANRRGGLGHFFIARRVQSVGQGQDDENETSTAKWVSLEEVQAALFDGRFISLTYAVSTALGLIRLLQHETQRKEGS
jgi:8-oxo-dGTP pyrophosphatase MutT (NUDIX family)